jgi:hypothetical protein
MLLITDNMKRMSICIIGFIIISFNSSCKKTANPSPETETPDYYITNGLFHVFVNSDSIFTVSIIHKKPNISAPYNYLQALQSSAFDYAFAPALGDSVNVIAEGKISMYVNVSYMGVMLVPTTQTNVGPYTYPATCCFTYAVYKYVVK